MLTIVEKVLMLQDADIFENTSIENLAHIAAITEVISKNKDEIIFNEGEVSDSMYQVVEGTVRLHRSGQEVMQAKARDVFGAWALFDDSARVVSAVALEDCYLLRIDRDEFFDLLADHTQITQSVLKTLSKKTSQLNCRH